MKEHKWIILLILIFSFFSIYAKFFGVIVFILSIIILSRYKLISKNEDDNVKNINNQTQETEQISKPTFEYDKFTTDKENDVKKFDSEHVTYQTNFPYIKARTISDSFIVLDFETTGLNYENDEIIQFAIVEFKNGEIINEHSKYFKPIINGVSQKVESITGLSDEFLKDKSIMTKSDMEYLKNQLENKTVVAHNASFDMKFLISNLLNLGIHHNKFRTFDTLIYARKYINGVSNYKLETLKNKLNLDNGQSHDALNDARATGQLALILSEKMNN